MRKTILCIDDTPQILLLYKCLFEDHGYKVVLASNGRDGLEFMKRHHVDCVILDYQMPEMDGLAVVRNMRQHEAPPPVIMVSGSDLPRELRQQVEAFIEKPMQAERLLECVGEVTECEEKRHHERSREQLGM
ncbi:MAG TPA: response regulator [Candidatus Sulfotelmatobacter sp.]|nr:response regulator [Candidatus Sulfotelmatobacter sp.]